MKREMLRSLRERYRQMESNEFYAIATLLDPRFKQKVFSCSSSAALAKQMLIAAHERLEDVDEESPTTTTKRARVERNNDSTVAAKKKSSLLWKYCDELMDENTESETSPVSTQSVVEEYIKEPTQPRKSDPLFYWKSKQDSSLYLTALAMHYLCSLTASVASE